MATFTATAAQANSSAVMNIGTTSRTVLFSHTTALSAGDVIQFLRIPRGAVVVDATLTAISFSAGVVTGDLGVSASASAMGAAMVLSGSAVTRMQGRGFGYSVSADDVVTFTVTVISAPPATATLALSIIYTNQNNTGG